MCVSEPVDKTLSHPVQSSGCVRTFAQLLAQSRQSGATSGQRAPKHNTGSRRRQSLFTHFNFLCNPYHNKTPTILVINVKHTLGMDVEVVPPWAGFGKCTVHI